MALLATARVELACGGASHALFEKACTLFEQSGMPFDAAVTRLEWARALAPSDREIAAEDARQALSAFERLGARAHADQAAALLRELGAGSRPGPRLSGELTRREREVFGLLSHGLSNIDIGGRLFISPKTVEHHVGRILFKLGLRSRAEAIAWALRNPPQDPTRNRGCPDVRGLVQPLHSSHAGHCVRRSQTSGRPASRTEKEGVMITTSTSTGFERSDAST